MSHTDTDTEHRLVEMANDGMLSFEKIALACLAFMSSDDITEMARLEELIDFAEEDATFEVYEIKNGQVNFLASYAGDAELEATKYAEECSDTHITTVIVEKVTDNGGVRVEIDRFSY